MRILVTGSRLWRNRVLVANAIKQEWIDAGKPYKVVVVQGGARGVDYFASSYAEKLSFDVETHDADWSLGNRAGYLRNKKMVDLGADVCLAFIRNESRGATMCAKLAEDAGIPVKYWIEP